MITALLFRHYKNYSNTRFIRIINNTNNMFSVYIGNNGVGKSAILEALDLVMNDRKTWNITQGEKKTEAFICPVFLIPKESIELSKCPDISIVSNFFWNIKPDTFKGKSLSQSSKEFIEYKDELRVKYETTHYLIMVGVGYDISGAYFSSAYDLSIKKLLGDTDEEQNNRANKIKDTIINLYSYLYIPVEQSPVELLQLQNDTMQKLLNKNVLQEIERILSVKQQNTSIVSSINRNLDEFINDVNTVISKIDDDYCFSPDGSYKHNLTVKDIRAKIIEAFFPLRSLKKGSKRISLLSSGEQRKAVIDIAYSTLIANKERKTEKEIILAIDEPENSMHISNCFNQFSRLEELSNKGVQILITTHWYGYIPIAENGNMHYLEYKDNHTQVHSYNFYNFMEYRRDYPDDIELKSMFDLASSLISYMRRDCNIKWLFCEGTDDKIYLQTMLQDYDNIRILPLGGCGNVIRLYQILVGFISEKSESVKSNVLFLIDTDSKRIPIKEPFSFSAGHISINLKRLQIEDNLVKLLDPFSGGTYERTEIEDCLNPEYYYKAVGQAIMQSSNNQLKQVFNNFDYISGSVLSIFRGDNSCVRAKSIKYIDKKNEIIEFIENDENKNIIANIYSDLCKGTSVNHTLVDSILSQLNIPKFIL